MASALAMVLSIKDIGDELPFPETWTLNTARIWNFVIGMVYRIANRKWWSSDECIDVIRISCGRKREIRGRPRGKVLVLETEAATFNGERTRQVRMKFAKITKRVGHSHPLFESLITRRSMIAPLLP